MWIESQVCCPYVFVVHENCVVKIWIIYDTYHKMRNEKKVCIYVNMCAFAYARWVATITAAAAAASNALFTVQTKFMTKYEWKQTI